MQAAYLGGGGAVAWLMWIHYWICAQSWYWLLFNVPNRFPILDPIMDPYPTGYWGLELRWSYVSKILHPRFWFRHLSTPVHVKCVNSFLITWFDTIVRLQQGLLPIHNMHVLFLLKIFQYDTVTILCNTIPLVNIWFI